MVTKRPGKAELNAVANRTVPDLIRPWLKVLFCGINPGLYTAYTGHHFARPGNRFWKALYQGGFTGHLFAPAEESKLLDLGYGITNLVKRASLNAAELSKEELLQGAVELTAKVLRYNPRILAFVGIEAYRKGFKRSKARLGRQDEQIAETVIWVLPNPSGLNAHYTPEQFAQLFRELKVAADNS